MKKFIITIATIISFCLIPLTIFAQNNASIVSGVQYKTIAPNLSDPNQFSIPKNKVLVVEFFSYGCPWCFQLEPNLENWLKTKPNYVVFERIPVTFEAGWDIYAKAYYTAIALKMENKITPALFKAIHVENKNLASEEAMQAFFASQGVDPQNFINTFDYSPGIAIQMQEATNLMMAYRVFIVPTIIVDGKYYTNPALVNGDDNLMIQVLNYLVEKEKPTSTKDKS